MPGMARGDVFPGPIPGKADGTCATGLYRCQELQYKGTERLS